MLAPQFEQQVGGAFPSHRDYCTYTSSCLKYDQEQSEHINLRLISSCFQLCKRSTVRHTYDDLYRDMNQLKQPHCVCGNTDKDEETQPAGTCAPGTLSVLKLGVRKGHCCGVKSVSNNDAPRVEGRGSFDKTALLFDGPSEAHAVVQSHIKAVVIIHWSHISGIGASDRPSLPP